MVALLLNVLALRSARSVVVQLSRPPPRGETPTHEDAYRDIPDIRIARKDSNLDPALTVFAVCSCGKPHPFGDDSLPHLPRRLPLRRGLGPTS